MASGLRRWLLDISTTGCDGHVNFKMPKTNAWFSPNIVPAQSYPISVNDSSIIEQLLKPKSLKPPFILFSFLINFLIEG